MIVRGLIRLAAATFVLFIASVSGWAAELPLPATDAPVFLVIFDLRSNEPGEITSTTEGGGPLNFPISAIDDEKVQCSALKARAPLTELKGYVECAIGHRLSGLDFNDTDDDATNDFPTVAERESAATAIAANIVEFRKDSSTRAISDRGSFIIAVGLQTAEARTITQLLTAKCLDPTSEPPRVTTVATYEMVFGRKPQFTIGEVERKSQIESDFNVLLTLASKFIAAGPVPAPAPPPPPPPDPCRRREDPKVEYRSSSKATAWTSGHAIPLAVKRANVTLDATLPAVVPQLLAATDADQAREVAKRADEFFRLAALHKQEDDDLSLFKTCPAVEPGRFDPLQQVVCGLNDSATTTNLAAVDALTKMTTPRRVTFLRWAVEHKTGEVRDKAMVALAQVPATAPPATAPGKEAKQTTKFLSGPLEHWSISADVFATRKTVFKKDDSGTFGLDGKPPVFYVSLNFLLGDLPSTDRSFLQNIELKWLVQGSKKPLDSMGFGVGFRGSYAKRFGFNFDLLSPYVGFTWTEQADSSLPRVRQTRFGVGLNINKALDWVK